MYRTGNQIAQWQVASLMGLWTLLGGASATGNLGAAQAAALVRGQQIVINGQPKTSPSSLQPDVWIQQDVQGKARVSVVDYALAEMMGMELLDADRATVQPVQWFSGQAEPAFRLPSQVVNQARYLDITDLAASANWTVSTENATLSLTLPPSQVTTIRQAQKPWGDRTVVQLDQPTAWQIEPTDRALMINLEAKAEAAVVQRWQETSRTLVYDALRHRASPRLVTTASNQSQLRIPMPENSSSQTFTLANPPRIVVDRYAQAEMNPSNDRPVVQDQQWSPGVRWRQQDITIATQRFSTIWLELDPKSQPMQLRPIWTLPSTMVGLAPVATMAQRWQAIAAINGGYFSRKTYAPLGALRRDGQWLSSPILNRGAVGWNDQGDVIMDRLALARTLVTSTGKQLPILHSDSGYVQAGLSLYTPGWGETYQPLTDNEVVFSVVNNQISAEQSMGLAGQGTVLIPRQGYLLVARSNRSVASSLPRGTQVQLTEMVTPSTMQAFPHIIGAGPLLIKDGQIVLDGDREGFNSTFMRQGATRSAIARLPDGKLLLVTVQGRGVSKGPTLAELAQVMQQLGAVDALNLDGGSSSALYLGGRLLNRSPRSAAQVHNSIGIFLLP